MNGNSHYKPDSGTIRKPDTFENGTQRLDPTPPRARRIKLSNAKSMRAEMARLYRMCDRDEIEAGEMNKRIWALGEMLKAYVIQELEPRLARIEAERQLDGHEPLLLGRGA